MFFVCLTSPSLLFMWYSFKPFCLSCDTVQPFHFSSTHLGALLCVLIENNKLSIQGLKTQKGFLVLLASKSIELSRQHRQAHSTTSALENANDKISTSSIMTRHNNQSPSITVIIAFPPTTAKPINVLITFNQHLAPTTAERMAATLPPLWKTSGTGEFFPHDSR